MNRAFWIVIAVLVLGWAGQAPAAPQAPVVEAALPPPAQAVGITIGAAATNLLYFPARFIVTLVTAESGGLVGWLNGGDRQSARSIWESTDGQGFITPPILEGRERLRFGGPQPY